MRAEPVTVRRIGMGLALAAALITSACAAGQQAATANEKPTLNGANAEVGPMHLLATLIEAPSGTTPYYPTGSDAAMKIVLVNSGTETDTLTSITSKAFADWAAFTTTADADAVLQANASSLAPRTSSAAPTPAESSPVTSSSAASTSSPAQPSPSASSSTTPLPKGGQTVTIPPGSRVGFGTPESSRALLILGTAKPLYPGTTITVTFTFEHAGTVKFAVPIALSNSPHVSIIPEPTSGEE